MLSGPRKVSRMHGICIVLLPPPFLICLRGFSTTHFSWAFTTPPPTLSLSLSLSLSLFIYIYVHLYVYFFRAFRYFPFFSWVLLPLDLSVVFYYPFLPCAERVRSKMYGRRRMTLDINTDNARGRSPLKRPCAAHEPTRIDDALHSPFQTCFLAEGLFVRVGPCFANHRLQMHSRQEVWNRHRLCAS